MSLFTSSRQPPNPDRDGAEGGRTPDDPAEQAPEDVGTHQDTDAAEDGDAAQDAADPDAAEADAPASDGTALREGAEVTEGTAGDTGGEDPGNATGDAPVGPATDDAGPGAEGAAAKADAPRDTTDTATKDDPDTDGAATDAADEAPADETAADEAGGHESGSDAPAARSGWRAGHPATARAVAWGTTSLAALVVLLALLLPNKLSRLTPYAFTRIPVEGIFGAALLLALPRRARRVAAVIAGVGLGLLTVVKCLDMGFYSILNRPFDLVLDWILFDDGEAFLRDSIGPAGATAAVIGVLLAVLALLCLTTLAVVRLCRVMVRNSSVTAPATLALGTVWVACAALGVQVGTAPVAAWNTAALVNNRAHQVRAGMLDKREFAEKASVDAFDGTPADQLLTDLRGKNVLFTFIESYGRDAVEDPEMGPEVSKTLAQGNRRLRKAGFSAKSAFLKSSTTGAGSWLAHSTFNSGLWISNEQRYRTLTSSDRMTLTEAFRRTGAWRTVGIMPGVTKAWPEGKFYGLDHIYNSRHLGYKGPKFSWTPVPDQFSLQAFQRLEHGKPGHKPLMAEIILASSHNPWAPIARMVDWNEIGDGSIYHAIKKEGKDPAEVWQDEQQVRTEYRRAIQYSLNSLISWMEKYGDKDTVLVFLGDHQPVPTVVGEDANRDVPISVVAHDKAVLDRIADWKWDDGLKPGPNAPVWRMDSFRDRFMTAYGSEREK